MISLKKKKDGNNKPPRKKELYDNIISDLYKKLDEQSELITALKKENQEIKDAISSGIEHDSSQDKTFEKQQTELKEQKMEGYVTRVGVGILSASLVLPNAISFFSTNNIDLGELLTGVTTGAMGAFPDKMSLIAVKFGGYFCNLAGKRNFHKENPAEISEENRDDNIIPKINVVPKPEVQAPWQSKVPQKQPITTPSMKRIVTDLEKHLNQIPPSFRAI